MTTAELREGFLASTRSAGISASRRTPLIPPADDPSTLFIVAGMQQFKPYFLGVRGAAVASAPSACRRCCAPAARTPTSRTSAAPTATAPSSRCSATSRSATTSRTRRSTIAWEFVTERDGARPRRGSGRPCTRATRCSGSTRTRSRSRPGSGSGSRPSGSCGSARTTSGRRADTGPCGPCSEIFYDRGDEHGCGEPTAGPGCECDRYMEFYNLVFMEYDLRPGNRARAAAEPERRHRASASSAAMCVLQEVDSVFDTDGFRLIMDWVEERVGRRLRRQRGGDEGAPRARRPRPRDDVPDRRRRDAVERGPRLHLPAASSAARAARPAHRARRASTGCRAVVIEQMGDAYPELQRARRRDRARRARRGGALPRDARARAEGVRRARRHATRSRPRTRSSSRRHTASRSS